MVIVVYPLRWVWIMKLLDSTLVSVLYNQLSVISDSPIWNIWKCKFSGRACKNASMDRRKASTSCYWFHLCKRLKFNWCIQPFIYVLEFLLLVLKRENLILILDLLFSWGLNLWKRMDLSMSHFQLLMEHWRQLLRWEIVFVLLEVAHLKFVIIKHIIDHSVLWQDLFFSAARMVWVWDDLACYSYL